jgi:hypothetical protein
VATPLDPSIASVGPERWACYLGDTVSDNHLSPLEKDGHTLRIDSAAKTSLVKECLLSAPRDFKQ